MRTCWLTFLNTMVNEINAACQYQIIILLEILILSAIKPEPGLSGT